jgi:hypothetical protein
MAHLPTEKWIVKTLAFHLMPKKKEILKLPDEKIEEPIPSKTTEIIIISKPKAAIKHTFRIK